MSKQQKTNKKCSCGLSLGPYGSIVRTSGLGKEKVQRYICANGHRYNNERLKDIYQDWLKFIAFRLKEKNTLTLREIACELETFIDRTGIGRELGKKRLAHTTIGNWFKNADKPDRTRQIIELMSDFVEWDDIEQPPRARFQKGRLEIDKIKKSDKFKAALNKWLKDNPEVKRLIERHTLVARGLIRPKHLLFQAWAMLEGNQTRVKQIQEKLNQIWSEGVTKATEGMDSQRLKRAKQKLKEVWSTIQQVQQNGPPTELMCQSPQKQQEYCNELSRQLNEAIRATIPRPTGKIVLKSGPIYQELYRELEYNIPLSSKDAKLTHHYRGE